MDIQRMRYFISAAKHMNFTKAAEEFFIAQSAMSQQIQKLENQLEVKLFTRKNKSIVLTTEGTLFLEDAQIIVEKYEHALERLKSVQKGYTGILNIAFDGQYERVFLPSLVHEFNAHYPNIQLKFHHCPQNRVSLELEQGTSDLVYTYPYEFKNSSVFETENLFCDTISVAMNILHPLANQDNISIKDLKDETIVMVKEDDSPKNYDRMKKDFEAYGFFPKNIEQVQSFDTMLLMVEAAAGIAFVPSYIKKNASPNLKFYSIDMDKEHFTHQVAAIYLKTNDNEFIKLFISTAKEYFQQMIIE
ncbi:MAG: LysR family transcriptional regulator [Eubacteriaceae bacterium]|nr:LysR family transcriptional regulator [Eubacteriaceae bacterium]